MKLTRESLARAALLGLVGAPALLHLLVVRVFGVNMRLWDEIFYFPFVQAVRSGGDWPAWLLRQHNEHRIVPTKLLMAASTVLTGWDARAEMVASVGLGGLIALGFWRLFAPRGGRDLLLFAPIAGLAAGLAQYENMLYGLQTCHFFTVLGVVWAVVWLLRGSRPAFGWALLAGEVASWSILSGLLVWPVGLGVLWLRGAARRRWLAWSAVGAVTILLYFWGFAFPAQLGAPRVGVGSLVPLAAYGLAVLGAPLAAGSFAWARAIGLVVLGGVAWLGLDSWRRRPLSEERIAALALVAFGLLSALVLAIGRYRSEIPALESRYVTYQNLTLVGCYLAAVGGLTTRRALAQRPAALVALALLVPGLAAADVHGLRQARDWGVQLRRAQFALQSFERQPDAVLRTFLPVEPVRAFAPAMRAARLGPFAEPQHLLLLLQPAVGTPGPALRADQVWEQELVCPVDRLDDVAVEMPPEALGEAGRPRLSVWSDGRELGAGPSRVGAPNGRCQVAVRLSRPLAHCAGQRLRVRLEPPAGAATSGPAPLLYPCYYDGAPVTLAGETLGARCLGLELNSISTRLTTGSLLARGNP
jgi:hypothetical protein